MAEAEGASSPLAWLTLRVILSLDPLDFLGSDEPRELAMPANLFRFFVNLRPSCTTTMAPSSLPKKARSLSSSKPVVPSSSTSSPPSTLLAKITSLSHSLPPIAPHNAILNPLADLITLFSSLPLSLSSSTTPPTDLELNRQAVHTSLHSIKACFEALISQGRLHGVLKGKKQKIGGAGGGNGEGKGESDDAVQKVKQWLQGQWNDYLAAAAKVVGGHWDTGVRVRFPNAFLPLACFNSSPMYSPSLFP